MSTSYKIGLAAISSMLSAYVAGSRLAAPDAWTQWRTYAAILAFAVCATVFLRHLLALHADLTAITQIRPLQRRDGKWLIP